MFLRHMKKCVQINEYSKNDPSDNAIGAEVYRYIYNKCINGTTIYACLIDLFKINPRVSVEVIGVILHVSKVYENHNGIAIAYFSDDRLPRLLTSDFEIHYTKNYTTLPIVEKTIIYKDDPNRDCFINLNRIRLL